MPHSWPLLPLALAVGLLGGCTTPLPVADSAWLRGSGIPAGSDVIHIRVALLERPIHDGYIQTELWATADEQIIAAERRSVLEDNGFRVGQIGGLPPARLQELLESERSNIQPRWLQVRSGKSVTLVLGPPIPQLCFCLVCDRHMQTCTFEQAECVLEMVPSLAQDGRTRLQFTPQVRHGEPRRHLRTGPDGTWLLAVERPLERYPALDWDVVLAANDLLLIGCRTGPSTSLGRQAFYRPEEEVPVQRLLVLRTRRAEDGLEPASPPGPPTRVPVLALQAAAASASSDQ